jgi:hypothetical protein
MRRPHRLIAAALLVAFSGVLGGCSSGFGGGFDPSDLLDFLDTKKKLPGDRKPVFPDGVPGLEQGVPKELYKGAQQQDQPNPDMAAQQTAAVPPPPPAEDAKPAKQARSKGKGKQPAAAAAAAPAEQPAATADGEAAPEEDTTPAAPPPPPKAKRVASRKRVTTPDQPADQSQAPAAQSAQQQQAPSAFPAPLPSNTFTR